MPSPSPLLTAIFVDLLSRYARFAETPSDDLRSCSLTAEGATEAMNVLKNHGVRKVSNAQLHKAIAENTRRDGYVSAAVFVAFANMLGIFIDDVVWHGVVSTAVRRRECERDEMQAAEDGVEAEVEEFEGAMVAMEDFLVSGMSL